MLYPPIPTPDKETLKEHIENAAKRDSDLAFVVYMRAMLKCHRADRKANVYNKEFTAELLKIICSHRAVNCATLLLEGDCRLTVDDLNVVVEVDGGLKLTPLHLAARSLCYDLTKLLLLYGANPNLSCNSDSDSDTDTDREMLPLAFALEALSNHQLVTNNWSLDKLPFTLFYLFFMEEMVEPFDTIYLLASRTKREHLVKISLDYAEQGEAVKLTALLLVAWDKLMPSYAHAEKGSVESWPIGKWVRRQIQLLPNEQECNLKMLHDRKTKLEATWKVLEILWDKYDELNEYRYGFRGPCFKKSSEVMFNHQVPMAVAFAMGVHPKKRMQMLKDVLADMECFKPGLPPREKGLLYEALENPKCSGSTILHVPTLDDKQNGFMRAFYDGTRQFHTSSKGQLAKVEKPSFQQLSTFRMCNLLFSIAKRGFQ